MQKEQKQSSSVDHAANAAANHAANKVMAEAPEQFEARKADHIRLSLDPKTQTTGLSGLDQIQLEHEAFPELNFAELDIATQLFGKPTKPIFISSMTAGHAGSMDLNRTMARVAEKRNWVMGVGSQRRQLTDRQSDLEWKEIRKACPRVRFFGNIGLAQLILTPSHEVRRLADSLEAEAMFVHANPLQECLQPEGTPEMKGGYQALERLVNELGLPVIVKEVGTGFSKRTLSRLKDLGVSAVDVSGVGGTHWGRIEGGRSLAGSRLSMVAGTFANWGVSTVDSLLNAVSIEPEYEVWASGGVRSGLDVAKLLAMGARMVGMAKPIIEAVMQMDDGSSSKHDSARAEEALDSAMERFEFELKTAMFCTGSRTVDELRDKKVWSRR